jgi:tetratricopeptide (TPR) repeat protein
MRRFLLLSLLIGGVLASEAALAYHFVPTEAEWTAWPDYCKARYVTTQVGGSSPFSRRFSTSQAAVWRNRLGDTAFTDIHHYCAGLAYMSRARADIDPRSKKENLRHALAETMYTFRQAPPSTPIYAQMAGTAAQILTAMGRPEEAIDTAKTAIEAQPKQAAPYVLLALLYRDQGKKKDALDLLTQANTVTEGKSAEVLYNLGMVELELGDLEAAASHAREAYALGYPLPGLKKKLQAAGAWTEPKLTAN